MLQITLNFKQAYLSIYDKLKIYKAVLYNKKYFIEFFRIFAKMKKILLIVILLVPTLVFCQNDDEFSVDPMFGLLLNGDLVDNEKTTTRFKLSFKNLVIGRIGAYFLYELNPTSSHNLLGIEVRLVNNIYLNFGYDIKVITNETGLRKEVGVSYEFDDFPIIVNYGYSSSMGSSLNVGYRIQFDSRNRSNRFY